jgi:hypothetical protein
MEWRPNHQPDDNFAGVVARIRHMRYYGAPEDHIHDYLVFTGLSPEAAHWAMRAAAFLDR